MSEKSKHKKGSFVKRIFTSGNTSSSEPSTLTETIEDPIDSRNSSDVALMRSSSTDSSSENEKHSTEHIENTEKDNNETDHESFDGTKPFSSPKKLLSKKLSKSSSLHQSLSNHYSADIAPLRFKMSMTRLDNAAAVKPVGQRPIAKPIVLDSLAAGRRLDSTDRNNIAIKPDKISRVTKNPTKFVLDKDLYRFHHGSTLGSINRKQFEQYLKEPEYIKVFKKRKGLKQFRRFFLAQELKIGTSPANSNTGTNNVDGIPHVASSASIATLSSSSPTGSCSSSAGKSVWSMKFSKDGRFLATGGKDRILRIWKVIASPTERLELDSSTMKPSKTVCMLNGKLISYSRDVPQSRFARTENGDNPEDDSLDTNGMFPDESLNLYAPVFHPLPYKSFLGHNQDILDIDWSKNNFILTGSMDKTVKLWHCDRKQLLKNFPHPDFVTCVKFHPNDDRLFISGCLDHKARLWSILDDEVSFEFDCGDLITSLEVSPGDSKYTILGTFNGYVIVLLTRGLEHVYSFHLSDKQDKKVKDVTTRDLPTSRTNTHHGPKVTGIECFRAINDMTLKLLVTSNDSKIRVFNLKDNILQEVLKGFENESSQISAHLITGSKNKQQFVIAPSEDHWIYCWKLQSSLMTKDKDKEHAAGKNSLPRSGSLRGLLHRKLSIGSNHSDSNRSLSKSQKSHYHHLHLPHPHHSRENQHLKNNEYIAFHAHHHPLTTAIAAPPETARTLSLSNDFICELTMEFCEDYDDVRIVNTYNKKQKQKKKKKKDADIAQEHDACDNDGDAGTNPRRIPTVDEFIGAILVTSDDNGIIRVFRSDISTNIRKRVLAKLQEEDVKDATDKKNRNSVSISEVNDEIASAVHALGNLTTNTVKAATAGFGKSCPMGNYSHSNSVLSLSTMRSSKSSTAQSISSSQETPTEPVLPAASDSQMRCDVCGGVNFNVMKPMRSTDLSTVGFFCTDCGNQVSNFR